MRDVWLPDAGDKCGVLKDRAHLARIAAAEAVDGGA
jgi:hypothetical protein